MLRSSPKPLKFYDAIGTVVVTSSSIGTIVKSKVYC